MTTTSSHQSKEKYATKLTGREKQQSKRVCQRLSYLDSHLKLSITTALPYTWRQELGEVDLVVPVPKGTRAKDLNIVIGKKKLSVGLKGQDNILDGELCKEIKLEDSTWTVGRLLVYAYQLIPFKFLVQRISRPFIFISRR